MEFSSQSDVWAFGITLYELFSLGETPYPGTVWRPEFLTSLKDGLIPSKPVGAPSDWYSKLYLMNWKL